MLPTSMVETGREPGLRNPIRDTGAYWMLEEQLTMVLADRDRPDRAPQMPLLGLLSGLTLALVLWSGIAWVIVNLVK